jgi:hypothetical protein
MSTLKTIILIVETDEGICYQAALTDRQESAIRSVLAALPDSLKLIDNPLSMEIKHAEDSNELSQDSRTFGIEQEAQELLGDKWEDFKEYIDGLDTWDMSDVERYMNR